MICDFCKHEVNALDMRELVIAAWCSYCGAFSDGKGPMRLPREMETANIYRETAKNAQERGTEKHNQLVRARNLLRVAQSFLEAHNFGGSINDELELAALCEVIAKEIGPLEDNITEEDGRKVAERLGIDIEKWAAELRAKVDAADVADAKREAREKGTER